MVNVTVVEKRQRNPLAGGGNPFSDNDPFSDSLPPVPIGSSTPTLPPEEGVGSGFIVSADGYILARTRTSSTMPRA